MRTAELITTSSESAVHGNQKICSIHLDKILIDLEKPAEIENVYHTELKVGHYTNYQICPTCGLASADALIGEVDDPRYFEHPDRYNADILWFTRGYVEYAIPNFIPASKKITQITISAELSSEAPGTNNDWPSDISFYLNDIHIGDWTSPRRFWRCEGSVDTGLVVCKLEPVRIAKTTCHQSKRYLYRRSQNIRR